MFVGPLIILQSHRFTASAGVLLVGTGLVLTAFAKSGPDFLLSFGLICGSGSGLIVNTCFLVLAEHYGGGKEHALAVGVLMVVNGISNICQVWPQAHFCLPPEGHEKLLPLLLLLLTSSFFKASAYANLNFGIPYTFRYSWTLLRIFYNFLIILKFS